jgi:hypothetical protein
MQHPKTPGVRRAGSKPHQRRAGAGAALLDRRFGVTRDVLRRAVTRVGAQPDKVEAYLRGTH